MSLYTYGPRSLNFQLKFSLKKCNFNLKVEIIGKALTLQHFFWFRYVTVPLPSRYHMHHCVTDRYRIFSQRYSSFTNVSHRYLNITYYYTSLHTITSLLFIVAYRYVTVTDRDKLYERIIRWFLILILFKAAINNSNTYPAISALVIIIVLS